MAEYYCNPLNVDYRYQFIKERGVGKLTVSREAADPSLIRFRGKYYLFASMTLSVWVSGDLTHWEAKRLPDTLPLYDYAPDVRVVGDEVIFCASRRGTVCDYYRTKDIVNGPYERVEGTFDFWDPDSFLDDDGRLYFYWGCSATTPIWGVELDPETLRPLTERKTLIEGHPEKFGYERNGEDNTIAPRTEEEITAAVRKFLSERGISPSDVPAGQMVPLRSFLSGRPYIEGAWMTKHGGRYYLQYACTGTQYNVYADGVYESDSPLGPFHPAKNNPYSVHPGGFMPGAGHGSTLEDAAGNFWHTATMQISQNHSFERRVGLWPAGFDSDGNLFCNQRFGDWPMEVTGAKDDPWKEPEWYLLSYRAKMSASSSSEGKGPERAADENAKTWWQAGSGEPGQWLLMDLGEVQDVHAVQINFADDDSDLLNVSIPGALQGVQGERFIDPGENLKTRWILEASSDGKHYAVIADRKNANTNLPHDFFVYEDGISARFLKLTIFEVPYGVRPCISGLRVFGKGRGEKPKAPEFSAVRTSDFAMNVRIQVQPDTTGYNVLWGFAPDRLYHSWTLMGDTNLTPDGKEITKTIGMLTKGESVYVRVDAFNKNGITGGRTCVFIK
ncbi:MAG: family 43 glycosylhydrolase [Lachnospiraceae bacterium]|jgi:hypothetical protein